MAPWLSHYNSIHPISDPDCNENKLRIKRKKSSPSTHFPLYLNCFLYPVQTVANCCKAEKNTGVQLLKCNFPDDGYNAKFLNRSRLITSAK